MSCEPVELHNRPHTAPAPTDCRRTRPRFAQPLDAEERSNGVNGIADLSAFSVQRLSAVMAPDQAEFDDLVLEGEAGRWRRTDQLGEPGC